jgi:hypothetical protein
VTLVDQGPHRDGLRAVVGVPSDLVRKPRDTPRTAVEAPPAERRVPAVPTRPMPMRTTGAAPAPSPRQANGSEWSSFRGMATDDQDTAAATRSVWFKGKLPTGDAPRHRLDEDPAVTAPGANGVTPDAVPTPEPATGIELPKRKPRGNLVAGRSGESAAPVRRDPDATRGFLSNYQTGIRQGVLGSGDHRSAQENP